MNSGDTRRRREKGKGQIFEAMMTENFTNLLTATKPQMQRAEGMPGRIKRKSTPTQVLFILHKIKEREKILKEARGKNT